MARLVKEYMQSTTKIEVGNRFNFYNEWSVKIETTVPLTTAEQATIAAAIDSIDSVVTKRFVALEQEAKEFIATKKAGGEDGDE